MLKEQAVGTIALTVLADRLRLDEFYLLPAHQGHGLGTRILTHCLAIADTCGLPLRLRYLKWNPVGSLYRRHGFAVIDETEIHFIMQRQPGGASPVS
jgi:GNAT superfamily N-acetyltransferase